MANEPSAAGQIEVSVCYALSAQVWLRELRLPAGATVADALRASGFAQAFPVVQPWERGVGVFGRHIVIIRTNRAGPSGVTLTAPHPYVYVNVMSKWPG